jgi:hypothetical protein
MKYLYFIGLLLFGIYTANGQTSVDSIKKVNIKLTHKVDSLEKLLPPSVMSIVN